MTGDSPCAPTSGGGARAARRSRLIRFRDRVAPAFAHRDFTRLWRANLGSTMAFWMYGVAEGWLVAVITESPLILGTLAMIRAIPLLLLSPFGGVLADRVSRTRLLIAAQVVMSLAGLSIGLLVAVGAVEVWHLAVSAIVIGASFAIIMPTRTALVSDLVPRRHVSNAVALTNTTQNASSIIGPALAGALIGLIGIAGTFFVQAAGYVWGTLNILTIRAGGHHRATGGSHLCRPARRIRIRLPYPTLGGAAPAGPVAGPFQHADDYDPADFREAGTCRPDHSNWAWSSRRRALARSSARSWWSPTPTTVARAPSSCSAPQASVRSS